MCSCTTARSAMLSTTLPSFTALAGTCTPAWVASTTRGGGVSCGAVHPSWLLPGEVVRCTDVGVGGMRHRPRISHDRPAVPCQRRGSDFTRVVPDSVRDVAQLLLRIGETADEAGVAEDA